MVPGGMRIGTPALTTRGFGTAEFEQVAEFIGRAVAIAKDCQVRGGLWAPAARRGRQIKSQPLPTNQPCPLQTLHTQNHIQKNKTGQDARARQAQGVQGVPRRRGRQPRRHQGAARRGRGARGVVPDAGPVERALQRGEEFFRHSFGRTDSPTPRPAHRHKQTCPDAAGGARR